MDHEIMGIIQGLLEAWFDYTTDPAWRLKFEKNATPAQARRIRELFRIVGASYIVTAMADNMSYEATSRDLLVWLASLDEEMTKSDLS